jgi:hypothetical protein
MARFKLFPRDRRPSLGELLGISQSSRQVSRKHHLRIVLDPMSPLKNAERRAKRRAGNYSALVQFARFLRRLFRQVNAEELGIEMASLEVTDRLTSPAGEAPQTRRSADDVSADDQPERRRSARVA